MYAIISASGHQHRVEKGSVIRLDRQALEVGAKFESTEVLLVQDEEGAQVGTPFVTGARVVGTVLEHGKAKKVRVFKYKAKKNYRRRYGHRSLYTAVRVDDILVRE